MSESRAASAGFAGEVQERDTYRADELVDEVLSDARRRHAARRLVIGAAEGESIADAAREVFGRYGASGEAANGEDREAIVGYARRFGLSREAAAMAEAAG